MLSTLGETIGGSQVNDAIVDVLLATFNGARFLPEQLASLECQTHSNWRLIVRDDGSTDRTNAVVEAFAEKHRERVWCLRDDRARLGACGNFAALLEASDAPYFMFCDQDDVWLPEKIADVLRTLQALEARRGARTPALAHSDLIVVDDKLDELHRSFWRQSRLFDPARPARPARLMLQNYVTGCASIGNAALRQAALPIPTDALMHDWWIALVAAILGEIAEHHAPTMLYRQHNNNEIGAKTGIIAQLIHTKGAAVYELWCSLEKRQNQAAAFLKSYEHAIVMEDKRFLVEFSSLRHSSFWRRKSFLFRSNLWPEYWLYSAAFLAML